jgi:hypothetical protein
MYSLLMDSEPPNFSGTFPLAGERIGPAWQALWRGLSDVRWTEGDTLATEVAGRHNITRHTANNLLRQAHAVGILVRKYETLRSRRRAFYKVARKNQMS